MRSVFLLLMVAFTPLSRSVLCPSSCVVCSDTVIICHKLLSIIDAPGSTKALMLTDGLIGSVNNMVFSDLSNMTVLVLSNNAISTIMKNAFHNLTLLTTLSLDHNHISTQSLDRFTFSWLHRLEILQLGNNDLTDIDGTWFQNSSSLQTLQLEGNLLISLNSSTFSHADLRNLETLDLSDNLLIHLAQDCFRKLPRLSSVDLSRNQLQSAPDAFSYLSLLSMLDLGMNRWNCTCELKELSMFLNNYIQAPDKVLYDGQRMVCVNADNPALKTVLDLTEANCLPANKNITMQIVTQNSISPQQYMRNVAIAIVFSFLGGIGITLGIIAIVYHKLSKKFQLGQEENRAGKERSESSTETAQWKFFEDQDALSMSHALYNSNHKSQHYRDRQEVEGHAPNMRPELDDHFICHNCQSTTIDAGKRKSLHHEAAQRGTNYNWSSHQPIRNEQLIAVQQGLNEKSKGGHNERRSGIPGIYRLNSQDASSQHRGVSKNISAVRIQQLALRNHYSTLPRETLRPQEQMENRPPTIGNHTNPNLMRSQSEETSGQLTIFRTISCQRCHQTYKYREADRNKQSFPFTRQKTFQEEPRIYNTMVYRDILGYGQSNSGGFNLTSQRSVTFDLVGSEEEDIDTQALKPKRKSFKTSGSKSQQKNSTQRLRKPIKMQGKKALRVKINLNPLRKQNKVNPGSSVRDEEYEETNRFRKTKKKKLQRKRDLKTNSEEERVESKADDVIGSHESSENGTKHVDPATCDQTEEVKGPAEEKRQELENFAETEADGLDLTDALQASVTLESGAEQEPLAPLIQEYVSSDEGSPQRKLRLILPEKNSNRPQTALDRKIR